MTFVAGEVVHPTKHFVINMPVGAAENIAQGEFARTDGAGNIDRMQAENNLNGVYVALEPGNNTGGANGAIEIQVAGVGSEVTVIAGGAIAPGAPIKVNASSQAIAAVAGDVEADLVVGKYMKKPGERLGTRCAANDVIIVKLGGSV
jgi:hypothetical protein